MERKEVLAGGGAEGRSSFLRFPRWFIVLGAATYPQNTESGCKEKRGPSGAGSVNGSRQSRGGTGLS